GDRMAEGGELLGTWLPGALGSRARPVLALGPAGSPPHQDHHLETARLGVANGVVETSPRVVGIGRIAGVEERRAAGGGDARPVGSEDDLVRAALPGAIQPGGAGAAIAALEDAVVGKPDA